MVDVRRHGIPNPSDAMKSVEALSRGLATYAAEKLPPGWGFAFMFFDYNSADFSWLSSAKRQDMIRVLREFAEKLELDSAGGPVAPTSQ